MAKHRPAPRSTPIDRPRRVCIVIFALGVVLWLVSGFTAVHFREPKWSLDLGAGEAQLFIPAPSNKAHVFLNSVLGQVSADRRSFNLPIWPLYGSISGPGGVFHVVPLWPICAITGLPLVGLTLRRRRRRRRIARGLCAACGYPRPSLACSAPCPECGNPAPI